MHPNTPVISSRCNYVCDYMLFSGICSPSPTGLLDTAWHLAGDCSCGQQEVTIGNVIGNIWENLEATHT